MEARCTSPRAGWHVAQGYLFRESFQEPRGSYGYASAIAGTAASVTAATSLYEVAYTEIAATTDDAWKIIEHSTQADFGIPQAKFLFTVPADWSAAYLWRRYQVFATTTKRHR